MFRDAVQCLRGNVHLVKVRPEAAPATPFPGSRSDAVVAIVDPVDQCPGLGQRVSLPIGIVERHWQPDTSFSVAFD